MISIAEAISDLLFVRDTVVVPGLGAFVKKPISAKVNPVANYFAMPSSEITFDAHLREDNDLVINYISEKNEIPEDEARRLLTMFVSDCFNNLKTGKKVVLKDIGSLSFDWADDLAFEPSNTLNYNADAFGLDDFSPVPVVISKSKDVIKAEIEQQQRDKNTPVTVDEKAVHEEDEEPKRHFGWLWILLGLLLLAGVGYGLHYFKIIDLNPMKVRTEKPTEIEPWTVTFPSDVKTWRTEVIEPQVVDTVLKTNEIEEILPAEEKQEKVVQEPEPEEAVQEPEVIQEPEPVKPEANIRIIAGCFAQEENAVRLANALKDKGYKNAFVEKRSNKWFVAFGRYATDEEATAALREIRATGEDKAWILK
jgi:hypothetical protein